MLGVEIVFNYQEKCSCEGVENVLHQKKKNVWNIFLLQTKAFNSFLHTVHTKPLNKMTKVTLKSLYQNVSTTFFFFFLRKYFYNSEHEQNRKCLEFLKWPNILRVRLDRTYFAETENWKHCSKIIFKCMNSIVRPIFNKKVTEN